MSSTLQLSTIRLRVADLDRSIAFYQTQIGLHLNHRDGSTAAFATRAHADSLLFLTEDRLAKAAPADAAGLFHAALLFPSRAALGRWLRQAANAGVKFDGFSDHRVSEALYFRDPDGNGLEFYSDRPRSAWPYENGQLQMATDPLDLPDLLAAGATFSEANPLDGAYWGHLHLRVTELNRSAAFYGEHLGMSPMVRYGSSAQFLAADGYHHHLGLNTWGGVRQPQPKGSLGLIQAVFARAGTTSEITLTDPDEIALRIVPLKQS
ncbi:MAG: VOC family protein [Opitutus sp.]